MKKNESLAMLPSKIAQMHKEIDDLEAKRKEIREEQASLILNSSREETEEENNSNAKAVNKNNWKETSGAQKKLRLSYKEQREWETIEGDIAGLEEAIAALETEIEKSASNYTRLNELMNEKTEKEAQLEEKMDRWMYLTDLVEQIESQK